MIKQEWINKEHWKQLNEEVVVTTAGDEIVNYLYVFNVRFNLDRLVRIEESNLSDANKAIALAEGYEYTDIDDFGVLLRFKTTRGDIFYQGAAINDN